MPQAAHGDTRRAWYMVGLLCVLAAMSYLDRYIVSLLAEPIIRSMGIDATDIGLLIGLGFGLLYAISCVPIAHMLDRGRRTRIVGIGVILWSASTLTSAFATSFPILLATRAGVAIGEAVLVPAMVSMVADLFVPARRTLPIGLFMAVSSLMGSGAFLIGGLAFHVAGAWAGVAGIEPWRLTLVIVGVPGLLLGPLWLATVSEPPRTDVGAAQPEPTIAALIVHLREHRAFYLPLMASFGASAITSYSFISWTATMLIRSYHLTVTQAGSYYGTIGLLASGAATLFWPAMSGFVTRRGRADINIPLLAAGLGAAHLLLAAEVLAGRLPIVVAMIGGAAFGFASAGGLAVLIVQSAAPPGMRAKLISLYMLLGNLVGLTCGPAGSAWISEHVFAGPDAMRSSLSLLGGILGVLTVVLVLASYRGYRALLSARAA